MTRGKIGVIVKENSKLFLYYSDEFNGDFYPENNGYGEMVLSAFKNGEVKNRETLKKLVNEVNKNFNYENMDINKVEITNEIIFTDYFERSFGFSDYLYFVNATDDIIKITPSSNELLESKDKNKYNYCIIEDVCLKPHNYCGLCFGSVSKQKTDNGISLDTGLSYKVVKKITKDTQVY